jgi:hypothetical protein
VKLHARSLAPLVKARVFGMTPALVLSALIRAHPWRRSCSTTLSQRYNIDVPSPETHDDAHKHHRHAVYASETTGLLLIAFLLLVLTLIRYWHEIHWSLR